MIGLLKISLPFKQALSYIVKRTNKKLLITGLIIAVSALLYGSFVLGTHVSKNENKEMAIVPTSSPSPTNTPTPTVTPTSIILPSETPMPMSPNTSNINGCKRISDTTVECPGKVLPAVPVPKGYISPTRTIQQQLDYEESQIQEIQRNQ